MTNKLIEEYKPEERLRIVEEILEVLRHQKADAIIGAENVAMIKSWEVEGQLQEQIMVSANRLREIETIYQNVPVGLCVLDRNLKFVRINKRLAKMNGVPAEEHLGRTIRDIVPELADEVEPEMFAVMETGEPRLNMELKGETAAAPGVERHWLEHWLPLYDLNGNISGLNIVVEEVTEQKKTEKELQKLNATLEEQVAERTRVAEHRAEKLREMALQMIHVEENERQRLARMLHDGLQQLLIGAKFKAGMIEKKLQGQNDKLKEDVHQLNEILDRTIESARSLSYELSPPILHDQGLMPALRWLAEVPHMQALDIDIREEGEIPVLSQNLKVFLFQAVRELLVNVIKHAGVDEAEVRVSSNDGNVVVEVIDEGKGFVVDEESFGYSISQGLRNIHEKLNLMNGHMDIFSKPGEGSRFVLSVPVADSAASDNDHEAVEKSFEQISLETIQHLASTINTASSDTISVLIADDHKVMRSGLAKILKEDSDFNVIGEVNNGLEAVRFVHGVKPDVIIMDITMPEMDGIEATRLINQKYPDIRIIGLTMHVEAEYARLMENAGAVQVLNKGGPAEQLFTAVREAGCK